MCRTMILEGGVESRVVDFLKSLDKSYKSVETLLRHTIHG